MGTSDHTIWSARLCVLDILVFGCMWISESVDLVIGRASPRATLPMTRGLQRVDLLGRPDLYFSYFPVWSWESVGVPGTREIQEIQRGIHEEPRVPMLMNCGQGTEIRVLVLLTEKGASHIVRVFLNEAPF